MYLVLILVLKNIIMPLKRFKMFLTEIYLFTEFKLCEFSIKGTSEMLDVIGTFLIFDFEKSVNGSSLDSGSVEDVFDVNNSSLILSAAS